MTTKLRAYAHSLGIASPSACLKPAASSPSGNVMSNANSVIAMANTPSDSARNRAAPTLSSCTRWWPLTPLTLRSHDRNCPDLEYSSRRSPRCGKVMTSEVVEGASSGYAAHTAEEPPAAAGVGLRNRHRHRQAARPGPRRHLPHDRLAAPLRQPRRSPRRLLADGLRACTLCQSDTQLHIIDLAPPNQGRGR